MIGFLLLVSVIGGLNWYLVFNEPTRRKLAEPGWSLWRRSKEGKEVDDAFNLAVSLIIAVACSTILVAVLLVALVGLFK
jgi:hypothetical protein